MKYLFPVSCFPLIVGKDRCINPKLNASSSSGKCIFIHISVQNWSQSRKITVQLSNSLQRNKGARKEKKKSPNHLCPNGVMLDHVYANGPHADPLARLNRFHLSFLFPLPFSVAPSPTPHALNTEFNLHLQTAISFSTWQALTHIPVHPFTLWHGSSYKKTLERVQVDRRWTAFFKSLKLKKKKKNNKAWHKPLAQQKPSSTLSRLALAASVSFATEMTFINKSCRCVVMAT